MTHQPDPNHHIEVRDSDRHVRVMRDGQVLADTRRAKVLYESGIRPRYYFPREDVVAGLVASERHTVCPYKGTASYWSVQIGETTLPNLIWYYPEAKDESAEIAGMLAFYDEQVELEIDGKVAASGSAA